MATTLFNISSGFCFLLRDLERLAFLRFEGGEAGECGLRVARLGRFWGGAGSCSSSSSPSPPWPRTGAAAGPPDASPPAVFQPGKDLSRPREPEAPDGPPVLSGSASGGPRSGVPPSGPSVSPLTNASNPSKFTNQPALGK